MGRFARNPLLAHHPNKENWQDLPAEYQMISPTTPSWLHALRRHWQHDTLPAWVLLPLRLFLGVTFVYAGLQKLTDPQFFNPHAIGYIGNQIKGFAIGSPIRGVLLWVVPHAQLFGGLIAYGELAIGLGVLAGLLLRPAAFFGLLLSITFFLSSSWRVHPYFYGADIVFAFAWLPVLLAGPVQGILPTLDPALAAWVLARVPERQHARVQQILQVALGIAPPPPTQAPVAAAEVVPTKSSAKSSPVAKTLPGSHKGTVRTATRQPTRTRRDFLWGILAGAAGMLSLTWIWNLLQQPAAATGGTLTSGTTTSSTISATPTASGPTTIATIADVPVNSAATFTLPSNQDPGVVVHLNSGQFVAFDATCTHQGCPVQYDPGSQTLQCPCHGAVFDPAHGAAVVQGPTNTPLTPVAITVNQQAGTITTQ